ncbi:hypothetical protein ACN2CC_20895 [Mesorhizobium muleiense]|uniref:hypothetical protein n=1 Tax=Mesorhizobium muleiense TaxID=1004279 RepID=UPI003AFA296E
MNWRKIKCYVEKEMNIIGVKREAGSRLWCSWLTRATTTWVARSSPSKPTSGRPLWDRAQDKTGAPPPKGLAKEKAQWLKPGLVGRAKFLKVEEKLRHASLKDFREED